MANKVTRISSSLMDYSVPKLGRNHAPMTLCNLLFNNDPMYKYSVALVIHWRPPLLYAYLTLLGVGQYMTYN